LAEHYLDTVAFSAAEIPQKPPVVERQILRPDFCPDIRPRAGRRRARFSRIERGLYRYGRTGEIYLCWRTGGRNVWRNLGTTDKKHAMAIKGVISYAEAQTGAHQVTVVPDGRGAVLETTERLPAVPTPPPSPTQPAEAQPEAGLATPKITLRTLAAEFKAQNAHLEDSTLKVWDYRLEMLSKHLDLDQPPQSLRTSQLRRVRGRLAEGLAPSTVNDIMGKVLRPLLELAVESGAISKSPLEGVKPLKKTEPEREQPTWQQAQEIIEEVAKRAPDTALVLRFMLFFGVGQAEVRALLGEHIHEDRGEISFRRQKTKKYFSITIFPHAKDFIQSLRAREMIHTGKPVFVWRNPRRALETACGKLGFPSYSPRALRRTFIIRCLELGVDPRVVAGWQGHADASLIFTTYGKFVSKEHAARMAEKLV
jgi:integrase